MNARTTYTELNIGVVNFGGKKGEKAGEEEEEENVSNGTITYVSKCDNVSIH